MRLGYAACSAFIGNLSFENLLPAAHPAALKLANVWTSPDGLSYVGLSNV